MTKEHRVTLTRRHAYRTLSNRVKTIRTPGLNLF
jgi:ribosomal protein L34E